MTAMPVISQDGCGCDGADHVKSLIGVDAALARIADHARLVPDTERVPLSEAQGRVLAAPVRATAMIPPFDNAAMDGYALNSGALAGEGPWRLKVGGRIAAGQGPQARHDGQGAVRIFTGAPVPAWADTVVMQEATRVAPNGDVILTRRPRPGQNVRRAGEDMTRGADVLAAGCRIGPRDVAASAAAGHAELCVRRKPRVALLVTGDEVAAPGSPLAPGRIWDVNSPMLTALLARGDVEFAGVCRASDTRKAVEASLCDLAGEVDLIVTTGGVSVGEEDHVKPALSALGAHVFFSGVALKPGKPISFGRLGAAHWLGLPGNPVSAYITWELFGTALLRAMTGGAGPRARRRHVVCETPIRHRPGRCEMRPARIVGFDEMGREVAGFDTATHSARLGTLKDCDGIVMIPADAELLPAGALIEYHPFEQC